MIRINKSQVWFVLSSIFLLISFHYVYAEVVSPWQKGTGYTYRMPTPWMFTACYVLCIAPAFIMPLRTQKPSNIMLTLIYMSAYIPTVFMLVFTGRLSHYTALETSFTLFVGLLICIGFSLLNPIKFHQVRRWTITGFIIFLVIGILAYIILLIATYGAHIEFVSFAERYNQRLFARTLSSPLLGYMTGITLYVLAPSLLAYSLLSKRYTLLPVSIAPFIVHYGTSAARADILSVALLVGVFWITGKHPRWSGHLILAAFAVINILTVYVYRGDKQIGYELAELTSRRTMANSGWQMITYHEFFSNNPLTYFSHYKIINWLIEYPYDLPLARLIGQYSGGSETNSNAHVWADGFAGAGLAGILLESIALGLVLWIIDSTARPFDMRVSATMVALYAVYLSNLGLGSALVGGGMWFMVLVFLYAPVHITVPKQRLAVSSESI